MRGRSWLDDQLTDLAAVPYPEQRRGPLELFQEAMRFPTDVLQRGGVEPTARDDVVANALPGDRYQLAPAASHEIGEAAWHAHLAWGAAKAAAMTRPTSQRIGILSRNLLDTSKLQAALTHAGHEVVSLRSADWSGDLDRVLVDLEHPSAHGVISAAVSRDILCLAYGSHVDAEALEAARRLGADEAVPRSQVLRDPAAFVRRL